MFLEKYLNELYLNMLYDKYEDEYLNHLNETNFIKIYNLFKKYKFYFIKDIIVTYLEIFDLSETEVEEGILKLKDKLGSNFVYLIGNDLSILEEIFEV